MSYNETTEITALRAEFTVDHLLPTWAWPGGYPLYYLDKGNNALCPDCANENDEFCEPLYACGVNYEDNELYCDHCNKRIESAYAEDNE